LFTILGGRVESARASEDDVDSTRARLDGGGWEKERVGGGSVVIVGSRVISSW